MRKAIIALIPVACWCLQPVAQLPDTVSTQHKSPSKINTRQTLFSLGAGVSIPGGAATHNAWLTKSPTINASLFIPFFIKYPPGSLVRNQPLLSIGVNITAVYYADGGRKPVKGLPAAYNITGQTTSLVSYRGNKPGNPGFSLGAGPQLAFNISKQFSLSASVSVGYTSINKNAGRAVQTAFFTDSAGNQTSCDFNLNSMAATRVSGISYSPSVRLQYMVTKRIGVWGEASWLTGPSVITENTVLLPSSNPGPGGIYPLQAIITGNYKKNAPVTSRFSATGFSGGIVIRFGGKKMTGNTVIRIDEPKDVVWDGKLKNLHRVASGLLVSNNGGLNALADQINKGGKSTASVQRYNDRIYLKVMTKYADSTVSDFYAADTAHPLGLMLPSGRTTLSCRNGGCINCVAEGTAGNEHCECRMSPNPNAVSDPYHPLRDCFATITRPSPLSNYLAPASIPVSLTAAAANGELTSVDKQKIKDVILKYFQTAQIIDIQIIRQGKRKYVTAALAERGMSFRLITEVQLPRGFGGIDQSVTASQNRRSIGWYVYYCEGICMETQVPSDIINPTKKTALIDKKGCGLPAFFRGMNCPECNIPGACKGKVKWVTMSEALQVTL